MSGQFHVRPVAVFAKLLAVVLVSTSVALLALIALLLQPALADGPAMSTGTSETTGIRHALAASFHTNLDYSHQWLAANDYKSLEQSAAALAILVDDLGRNTAEAEQGKIGALRHAVDDLSKAASSENGDSAQAAIVKMPDLLTVAMAAKPADSPAAVRKTPVGFTPLMHLIDGTFTDARASLATGDCDAAKKYAVVLAELGQYLAIDRNGNQWHEQSDDLVKAAQEIAASKSNDPKQLRGDFHNLYANCEACHHRR